MIWNVIQALTAFCTLIYGLKQYKRLSMILNQIRSAPLTNVSKLHQIFSKIKNPSQKLYVVLKGIAKAHQQAEQKNILSLIQFKDLRLKPTLVNSLQKIGWNKIIPSANWIRPRKLKNVKFYLKDLLTQQTVSIENLQNSNISGALTQVYTDRIKYLPINNKLIMFAKDLYSILCNIFPLNLISKRLKYGEEIKYFGIMDGQFLLAIGQVCKNEKGIIQMKQPFYLTKQKAFIQKRLKIKLNYMYWIILVIGLIKVFVLYQIGKKAFKIFMKKRQQKIDQQQEEKRSQSEGDFANCIICYSNIRSVVLKPCRHYGFCTQCYEAFKSKGCPLCKVQIQGIIKIIKKK